VVRGNVVGSVLLISIGIALAVIFFTYVSNMSSSAVVRTNSAVSEKTATVPVSVVYAVGDYNGDTGTAHICIGIKADSRPTRATSATVTVRHPVSGHTIYVATDVSPDCNVLAPDAVCSFCFDAPISPGRYDVSVSCPTCLRAASSLVVR